jgi:hypothetical protein
MIETDTLTPSASLRDPRVSFSVRLCASLAALPRLASGAIVSVSLFLLTAPAFVSAQSSSLQNPLQFPDITSFVSGALKAMVMIALPIIALFVVYSGFLFVSARGNEEGITKAKNNFLYVVIGAILILGAWVIATLIGGTVTQLTG